MASAAKRAEMAKSLAEEMKNQKADFIVTGVPADEDSAAFFPQEMPSADATVAVEAFDHAPVAKKASAKKAVPAWKSGSISATLDYLLGHQTISARTHTDIPRLEKETRADFPRRIYGGTA